MRAIQVVCLVLATAIAGGLLSATPSDARNLNLQNQNHVGHCDVAGNCRPGHTGTSMPVAGSQGRPGSLGATSADRGRLSGGHAGRSGGGRR
jgi:hypothetical protein